MALEMKVHRETAAYEPKPMFGATWRQIAAIAFMILVGGGLFAAIVLLGIRAGQTFEEATSAGMYVIFPVLIPAAMWGWWRPMGLKPEQFLQYSLRFVLMRKQVTYADTLGTPAKPVSARTERATDRATRRAERRERAAAIKSRKALSEHSQTARRKRG